MCQPVEHCPSDWCSMTHTDVQSAKSEMVALDSVKKPAEEAIYRNPMSWAPPLPLIMPCLEVPVLCKSLSWPPSIMNFVFCSRSVVLINPFLIWFLIMEFHGKNRSSTWGIYVFVFFYLSCLRDVLVLSNWSYRQLGAAMWHLGIKPYTLWKSSQCS